MFCFRLPHFVFFVLKLKIIMSCSCQIANQDLPDVCILLRLVAYRHPIAPIFFSHFPPREPGTKISFSGEDFRRDAHCALRVTRFTVRYFLRVSDAKSYLTVVLQSESRYQGVRCVYYLLASPIYFPRRNFSVSDCEPFYSIGSSSHFWPHILTRNIVSLLNNRYA